MTTAEQRAEWARLADEATPGPWRPGREPPPVCNDWFDRLPVGTHPVESTGTLFALGAAVAATAHAGDAAFIAASRDAVPALLADLAAAESERDALREALRVIHTAVRWDGKGQHNDARAWLDARGIYNGDLDGSFDNGDAVLEAVARAALAGKGGDDGR